MLEYYGLDVFFTWILCLFDCRFGLGGFCGFWIGFWYSWLTMMTCLFRCLMVVDLMLLFNFAEGVGLR